MERVQFQQEQMLAELKDLVEKGLFTLKETKQIMNKRTAFETALVRRVAKIADFLRYASYEMSLEQLRRKRVERLKLPPAPATVSDYALVRRQFHIFERALKKFKSDVGLWIQYIHVAKREGARALVGRITARALQLHPNTPALYILAASHELDNLSPSAARTLLQRGLRLNSGSIEIWREYVRMELGFIESLRRRWDILGIDAETGGKGKEKSRDTVVDPDLENDKCEIGEGALQRMEVDAEIDGDQGTAARKEIMQGAIVRSVISSAAQAVPKIALFETLKTLLNEYPSPASLQRANLTHLFDAVKSTLSDDARAIKLLAGRFLGPEVNDEELVEGLRCANEEMLAHAQGNGKEDVLRVYAEFVEEWMGTAIDENLKLYLISSLVSLIRRVRTSPSLLSAHIRLLIQSAPTSDTAKILRTARKYTTKAPKSAQVWLARLAAERELCSENVERAWAEARGSVAEESPQELRRIWLWGLEVTQIHKDSEEGKRKVHEALLKESMRDSSLRDMHEMVLMRYVTMTYEGEPHGQRRTWNQEDICAKSNFVGHVARAYLPTGRVWQKVFELEAEERGWESSTDVEAKGKILGEVFEMWRRKDGVNATVGWIGWLMRNGKGKEAKEVVMKAKSWLGDEEKTELEKRWTGILDEA